MLCTFSRFGEMGFGESGFGESGGHRVFYEAVKKPQANGDRHIMHVNGAVTTSETVRRKIREAVHPQYFNLILLVHTAYTTYNLALAERLKPTPRLLLWIPFWIPSQSLDLVRSLLYRHA